MKNYFCPLWRVIDFEASISLSADRIQRPEKETCANFHLRTVPANSQVFLRGLLNMREMQILTSVIEIQKENCG